jgi:hypothetical protein
MLLTELACVQPSPSLVFHALCAVAQRERVVPGQGLAVEVVPVTLPEVLQRPPLNGGQKDHDQERTPSEQDEGKSDSAPAVGEEVLHGWVLQRASDRPITP